MKNPKMKSGTHRMPDGSKMKDSEMKKEHEKMKPAKPKPKKRMEY